MNEIIEQMIAEELASANEKFPAFASTHEGWAVLKEEIEEHNYEAKIMNSHIEYIWFKIKNGATLEAIMEDVSYLREKAKRAVEEAIQVEAMCDKYKALNEKKSCGTCKSFYRSDVTRTTICLLAKNKKTDTNANDSCTEWKRR